NQGRSDIEDGSIVATPKGGGQPVTLVPQQLGPSGIAVDESWVYWTNVTDGKIQKVPVSGGEPILLAATGSFPFGIAVDAKALYWTDAYGEVVMQPLAGANGVVTSLAPGHFKRAVGIATDGSSVFWTVADGEIMQVSTEGGNAVARSKTESYPVGIAVDSS